MGIFPQLTQFSLRMAIPLAMVNLAGVDHDKYRIIGGTSAFKK